MNESGYEFEPIYNIFRFYYHITMSWGHDLWDRYDSVLDHVTTRADEMVGVHAKFIKEKAELEKEYAKGLRKLVAKYEPRKRKKKENREEPTESSSFR